MRCCAILTTGIDPNNWYQSQVEVRARQKSELGSVRARRKSPRSVKMERSKIGTEKFNGSDFDFWKMQIEDYLYQKDLHEPLLGVKPDTMTTK